MLLKQFQTTDSWLLVAIIEAKISKKASKLVGVTGKKLGTPDSYFHHPYRALVVKACKTYNIGGFSFESEINEGDVVLFPHTFNITKAEFLIIENKQYILVRYSDIRGFFTPTEEQRKKMNPLIAGGTIDEEGNEIADESVTEK